MVYSGLLGSDVDTYTCSRLSEAAKKGYVFGQVGGNGGRLGAMYTLDLRSYTSQHVVKRGDFSVPSCAAVPLGPRTCPNK